MNVLTIDIGGTNVKILATGQNEPRKFPSGPKLTAKMVKQLIAALQPNDVVLGGGNVKKLKALPEGCRAGDNANAFLGGFRLWEADRSPRQSLRKKAQPKARKQSSRSPVVAP